MEVVSTSNLVSWEDEKTITALDSQFHDGRTVKKRVFGRGDMPRDSKTSESI